MNKALMSETVLYTATWLFNPGEKPLAGGALAVRNNIILDVGTADELARRYNIDKYVDYPGCVLLPGFVNAHTHLELTHFPDWRKQAEITDIPADFTDWILQMVRVKRSINEGDVVASFKAGAQACLQAGTAFVGDIVSSPELLPFIGSVRLGGRYFSELIGHEQSSFRQRLNTLLQLLQEQVGTIYPGLSPHAPYTLNETVLADIAQAAKQHSLPLSLHLAESAAEIDLLHDSSGAIAEKLYPLAGWQQFLPPPRKTTPARFFDAGGLLTDKTIAVHCVHCSQTDAQLLKKRGVTICLCPRSNHKLGVGSAPVSLFKKLQIPLCLGTDSLASNDSLSLWDEIRFAVDCYNGELTPDQLLTMATSGGAAALGIVASAGTLSAGKQAAFQVVELSGNCTAENLIKSGKLIATNCHL